MKRAKKHLPATVVVIAVLIIFATIGSLFYTEYLERTYDKEITYKLENIAIAKEKDLVVTTKQIFNDLSVFSMILSYQDEKEYQQGAMELLRGLCEDSDYISIGIADENGQLYATNGMRMNISDTETFQMSMQGLLWISSTVVEGIANPVLVFSAPIRKDGSVCGIISAVCDSYCYQNALQVQEYMDKSSGVLVNSKGIIVSKTTNALDFQIGTNILDYLYSADKDNELQVDQMHSNMKSSKQGRISFKDSKSYFLYYYPVRESKWYFISIIPQEVMMEENNKLTSSAYLITGFFIILYLITFLIVMRMENNNRKKIERIAYVDELTGGISFDKFKKDAEEILRNSPGKSYAMVSIDVDKFKVVNDIFGYEEGNNVIRYIWGIIRDMIHQDETFAHRRADQFVVLLNSDDEHKMIERINALSNKVHQRETQNEKNFEIILSIGIYMIKEDIGDDFILDNAIDRAELAKQSVKGKHNLFYAVYDEKLRQKILRDQEIENRMEQALKNKEFKVYYQPKYDSGNCEIVGAEALVRWYNEKTGMIFPNEFIPLFENNGFIVELDKYMFEQVCADIRAWMQEGYKVVPVSVNLSQLQLYNLRFIDEYKEILEKYNVPPKYVQLELTETTLFSEASILNKIIDKLHNIGFKILMDDFGTGYSSLNMLKNVPIDILKLDKSFVDDIGDPKVDIVVSTIVSLGQSLDMRIVAEGVETQEQYEFLRDIFCDEIQGYYFSRPIAEKEFRQQLIKEADIIGY